MKYRKIGDCKVSALGFGCMRLPVIDNNMTQIDEPEATRMLHYAIEQGVNYIDTAVPYHGGNSEPFVGNALKGGWRDRVRLATKLPSWAVQTTEDFDKHLNEQLGKLQTDCIEFYLLHSLKSDWWEKLKKLGALEFLGRAIEDGRIKYAGFSFHDELSTFKEIVDSYDWDFCQIQYNYMDENHQAGTEGLNYAVEKGIDVIVMEPLRGGKLTKKIPDSIQALMDQNNISKTQAELALRWVWNRPDVSIVLSGMSTMDQVVENCRVANESEPNSLTADELVIIEKIRDLYLERTQVPCTECNYCLPCPEGVDITGIFRLYNDLHIYQDEQWAQASYGMFMPEGEKASNCNECGQCEEACPQDIAVIEKLKECHAKLCGETGSK